MDRWEDLVREYEQALGERRTDRALHVLGEFALTAPASSVRRHYELLAAATASSSQGQSHEPLGRLLKLLRQRGTIAESSLSSLGSKSGEGV
jgi:hypothetical protein